MFRACSYVSSTTSAGRLACKWNFPYTQSTAWIFSLYFQLPYLPEETCFQQAGSSDQWKVPASLSLFLKSEKIPALLYVGKGLEYRPFRDFRPIPSVYWPQAQISNHGRVRTYALLLNRKPDLLSVSLESTLCAMYGPRGRPLS